MSRPNPFNAKVTNVEPLSQGKWIQTRKIDYIDAAGNPRVWEMAVRTTQPESGVDAVSVFSLLKGDGPARVVLVKQFRPPANKVMIEMPAGLVDPNEKVEVTAERELYEETGYRGKCIRVTPMMFADPGLANATMVMAQVEVDLTKPENQNPQQKLDDGEYIDVFTVSVNNFRHELDKLIAEGCAVDAKLYHFALGLEMGPTL
ncbi:hypothetical protein DIURU_001039 [Diutina rugosa]|uniref:Nudix hydrolase domain-containing protein n=1 Tax=Diutina rugosa TaxID=5481 RepID=A0A642UW14_DIURU|nr:uncharacterized protein DIURU_001039 [Diutina rugosa]KAA8906461.1 hypothetical protein DIURU_001039 [Diutina rugosa]